MFVLNISWTPPYGRFMTVFERASTKNFSCERLAWRALTSVKHGEKNLVSVLVPRVDADK